jgi:hypothetical protein
MTIQRTRGRAIVRRTLSAVTSDRRSLSVAAGAVTAAAFIMVLLTDLYPLFIGLVGVAILVGFRYLLRRAHPRS